MAEESGVKRGAGIMVTEAGEEEMAKAAFEAERQVLLNSMADQLRSVMQKIDRVNDNLAIVADNQSMVGEVSEMWRSSHEDPSPPPRRASSLRVFSEGDARPE